MPRRASACRTAKRWTIWTTCSGQTASGSITEAENFFLIQWYPDVESAKAKLAELDAMGDGSRQYLVDMSLKRENPSSAENFGNSNPVQLRS